MPDILDAVEFTRDHLPKVGDFFCGEHDWEIALVVWLKEIAIERVERGNTKVWLYYNQSEELVGFGSLGTTRRRYPDDRFPYVNLALIPSLAIQVQFQGQPEDPPKYSSQIITHLIDQAKLTENDVLTLDVYEENHKAIAFYKKMGFERWGDIHRNQIKMAVRL